MSGILFLNEREMDRLGVSGIDKVLPCIEPILGVPVGAEVSVGHHAYADVRWGFWRAGAYTERIINYDYDELMVMLKGTVKITSADGHDYSFGAGDCFVMLKGFSGIWHQDTEVTKVFALIEPLTQAKGELIEVSR